MPDESKETGLRIPSGDGLLRSLHSQIQLPAPYSEDLLLLQTTVAGTTHTVGIEALEPYLRPGDRLELVRVPHNPSDPNAIKIYTGDRVKLGYVPRRENQILARLLDAGKLLYAVLRAKQWQEDWLKLDVDIFLTDD